ncbi:MAG: exosortase H, partial [Geobacteraceae bacterium]|nr:exosortase H [Geobacteraceae bacterium]
MARTSFPHPILRFSVISGALFLMLFLLPESSFVPLTRVTAALSGWCIGLFGMQAAAAGDMITLNGFRVRIITECTALYPVAVFAAFVLAWPAPWRKRLAGLLAGGAVLTAANLVRIAVVAVVGAAYPRFFEAFHVYLGQVAMLLLVMGLAKVWLRWVSCSPESGEGFLLRSAVLASLLFPVWLVANTHYVRMLDRLVQGLFSWEGYSLVMEYRHAVYFQTFNVVLLAALLLAEQKLEARRKLVWIAAGAAILAAGHVLFRVGNVLLVAFGWRSALVVTSVLVIVGEYLLPVLVWLAASSGCPEKRPKVH